MIEKPFGTDLETARRLNDAVHACFARAQVYRIDHYLGKETVQNILVLRFANTIFEPVWNRNYVDHVQITVAEEVTVGRRGSFYDETGILRDMFQNHLLQLLMATAMEAPVRFEAETVRDEKVKVLSAIRAAVAGGRGHATRCAVSIVAIGMSRESSPTARRPRLPRSSWRSTIGGGRACRFICAAARPCRAARRKS